MITAQAIPGVPGLREGLNPATWALQITNVDSEQALGVDFADAFLQSTAHRSVSMHLSFGGAACALGWRLWLPVLLPHSLGRAAPKAGARCREMEAALDRLEVPAEGSLPLRFATAFAQPLHVQYWLLLRRCATSYSRNIPLVGARRAPTRNQTPPLLATRGDQRLAVQAGVRGSSRPAGGKLSVADRSEEVAVSLHLSPQSTHPLAKMK